MHLPVRRHELSEFSAPSGAIFLASEPQVIVIRRHQKIGDITVYLGDGEGGRCPPPSGANDNGSDVVVRVFERKEFASSSLRQMPFVKITASLLLLKGNREKK